MKTGYGLRRWIPMVMLAAAIAVIAGLLGAHTTAQGSPAERSGKAPKKVERMDRGALALRLRAAGYKTRGGIERAKTDSQDKRFRSLPHFSSSFTDKQVRYPYTMVGYPPASGKTARLRSVIVPLVMNFVGFEIPAVFDPAFAVNNIVRSPIFADTQYVTESGQFGDVFQRATFWNRMDPQRRWHTLMERPRVARPIAIQVTPDIGELLAVGPGPGDLIGNVLIGALDSQLHTIIQLTGIEPDEVPIFVTQNVFAQALGYHDAFPSPNDDDSETLQTLIYTSWLDINLVGDLLADVSTLNHELGEWLDDPFVNNIVPLWAYPPLNVECADNPYLEVGDPQGNGPEYYLFPTVPITVNNFTYHLQDLVMVPWFAHEKPSTAVNGWYSFPDPTQITSPAAPCR